MSTNSSLSPPVNPDANVNISSLTPLPGVHPTSPSLNLESPASRIQIKPTYLRLVRRCICSEAVHDRPNIILGLSLQIIVVTDSFYRVVHIIFLPSALRKTVTSRVYAVLASNNRILPQTRPYIDKLLGVRNFFDDCLSRVNTPATYVDALRILVDTPLTVRIPIAPTQSARRSLRFLPSYQFRRRSVF